MPHYDDGYYCCHANVATECDEECAGCGHPCKEHGVDGDECQCGCEQFRFGDVPQLPAFEP